MEAATDDVGSRDDDDDDGATQHRTDRGIGGGGGDSSKFFLPLLLSLSLGGSAHASAHGWDRKGEKISVFPN